MTAVLDTNCWSTLADFKEHLDIDSSDTSKDNFLTNILNAAYKAAVNYIGQDLNATAYTEYHDGDDSDTILLDNYPIISVETVFDDTDRLFDPTNYPSTIFDSDDYAFYANTGKLRLLAGFTFTGGVQNIQVRYTAGYLDVPYDAVRGLILLAAYYAQRAGSEGRTNETLGGRSVGYEAQPIPLYIRQLLLPYKKFST